jgi:signal transduction histidine kinase
MTGDSPPPTGELTPAQLRGLLDISVRLNSTEQTDQLLAFIIETAAEVLACDAASLLLYDEDTGELRFSAATGADPDALAPIPVPLHGSLAGTIFRENEPVRVDSTAQDERHFGGVDEEIDFQTRSLLGVPMRIGDRVVGVLEALNKREGDFTDEDELMLTVIADQAAVAIRNARQVQALQEAHDRMARTEAMKRQFLTLASHELRTPLAGIKGFTEIIREETGPESAEYTDVILEQVGSMEAVLAAMSEMTILYAGVTSFDPRPLRVTPLFEAASEAVAPLIEQKGHTLRTDIVGHNLLVCGVADKLTTALSSLLDNAARFTPAGGTIILRARAEGSDTVLLEVEDTGIGLAPSHLDAIFDDFFQVEAPLTRTHGGLGLGLTIARGIAEVHGGRLWAESPGEGRGATFYFLLPTGAPNGVPMSVVMGSSAGRTVPLTR